MTHCRHANLKILCGCLKPFTTFFIDNLNELQEGEFQLISKDGNALFFCKNCSKIIEKNSKEDE